MYRFMMILNRMIMMYEVFNMVTTKHAIAVECSDLCSRATIYRDLAKLEKCGLVRGVFTRGRMTWRVTGIGLNFIDSYKTLPGFNLSGEVCSYCGGTGYDDTAANDCSSCNGVGLTQ